MLALLILFFVFNVILFLQDALLRKIHWFWLPCLFIANVFIVAESLELKDLLQRVLINSGYVVFLLLVILIWLKIRKKNPRMLFQNWLGIGDVLYLLALTPLFHLQGFVLFICFASALALLTVFILNFFRTLKTIPFVSVLSFVLLNLMSAKILDINVAIFAFELP